MKTRRTFTVSEKLQILSEGATEGVARTCRKHQIAVSLYYKWKDKHDLQGAAGLSHGHLVIDKELKQLKQENEMLKKLLAEKEVALHLKDALLKKVQQRPQKNGQ